MDVASLDAIASFAKLLAREGDAVDLLFNNAGVMVLPERRTTQDEFEVQFGTNYLGHFAPTARLLPLLRRGQQPRVVNVSSILHRRCAIAFDDLQAERSYSPWGAYAQSKLAMLIFALELPRRSDVQGWGLTSLAVHPGWARTDLFANGSGADGRRDVARGLMRLAMPFFSQSAGAGEGRGASARPRGGSTPLGGVGIADRVRFATSTP